MIKSSLSLSSEPVPGTKLKEMKIKIKKELIGKKVQKNGYKIQKCAVCYTNSRCSASKITEKERKRKYSHKKDPFIKGKIL